MISRSLRRRHAQRRRLAPAATGKIMVTLVQDGLSQSFLILPGQTVATDLDGVVLTDQGWQRLHVPVAVRAHLS